LRGTSASPVLPHGAREGVRRFYEFVSARMLVWANRTAGLAPEDWTADPKLRWGHFCNVYVRTGPQSVGAALPSGRDRPTDWGPVRVHSRAIGRRRYGPVRALL
jgi:hypothetical protein